MGYDLHNYRESDLLSEFRIMEANGRFWVKWNKFSSGFRKKKEKLKLKGRDGNKYYNETYEYTDERVLR